MLNKGLKDKESTRIDNVLKTLLPLVFVPEPLTGKSQSDIEGQLGLLGLTTKDIANFSPEALTAHLIACHLDWGHLEKFADFLLQFSHKTAFNVSEKGIYLYHYIQRESKSFSFEIHHKLTAATK
ncbi:hypothetical protein [Flavobacterium humi]|uniref:Uncharacterized protein n=1 Tax=Flavobacterium humi TaxID=2562683 RepID=A0A4Z0LA41_9FLAO|nr:hypothetical protein [Flavobacterium humi]TGD58711.1 hypothetical protein E4635_07295 [Flavobacterium humi]